MKKFKVIMLEPDKLAKVVEIEATLKSYQSIVGGYIECIYPFNDNACIVGNDEAKLIGLPLHRALRANNEIYDILAGTCFIIGIEGEDFCSLTDEQCRRYLHAFKYPEIFFKSGGKIIATQFKP